MAMTDVTQPPTLSVVMPVFNSGEYLDVAIQSILDQTCRNFEFIIVDDGSTDDSFRIAERYALVDRRIRVISRSNRGVSASLNEGIALSRGQWIARMDSDDIAMPDRLERQLTHLKATGADISGGAARLIGYRTRQVWHRDCSDSEIKLRLCFSSAFISPTVVYRTELAKSYPYNEKFDHAEDYDVWARIAADGHKMANTRRVVLAYRVHENQASRKELNRKLSLRDSVQQNYIDRMIEGTTAFATMSKFADPSRRPTLADGAELFELMNNIKWAPNAAKNSVFQSLLKYIKPAGPAVYFLGSRCSKKFGVPQQPPLHLLIQSWLATDSDSRLYDMLKRLVR